MTKKEIKARITEAFRRHAAVTAQTRFSAIPRTATKGKLYEAWVLAHKNITHTVRYTDLAADRFKGFWLD